MERKALTGTPLTVSTICIGTSPLGGMKHLYGYDVDPEVAEAAVIRTLESDINFLDTSNGYSDGESEHRIGHAIATYGGLPEGFVLATKADPLPDVHDFSGDRIRRSLDESLERLGVDHIPLFHLHDPERFPFEELTAPGGAVDALLDLQSQGVVGSLGVAGGDLDEMRRYVDTGAFQVLLNHNLYTLVNQDADELIDHVGSLGMGFINAAPFGGGMLAQGPERQPKYRYATAPPELVQRVIRIREVCDRAGVPLAAAALQFSTRDPRIDSTVVGVSRKERIDEVIELLDIDIPETLWDDVSRIVV